MDFKALSIAILEELTNPHADREYIAAKLRACLDNDATTLYNVIDTKNKALAVEHAQSTTQLTTLNDELKTLRTTVENECIQEKLTLISRFEKEKRNLEDHINAKDCQLGQAQTTFNQMNEYIQKTHAELEAHKASLKDATKQLADLRKAHDESEVVALRKEVSVVRSELDTITEKYYTETKQYKEKIASLTYKIHTLNSPRAW